MRAYVDVDRVTDFVKRTHERGVPLRVCFARAERRFGMKREWVRSWYEIALTR